ncbi:ABC transporter ATP-binding protein [Mobilicoccus pelagius]|uniref:ABC-type quaternary amine transporter n=1 Tax=Mobilicoccus pelagius NBRC 104925 TaxID=1089455 RepID=H5UW44_9MICO|nr:ABC transporter ATP-binding protein [Mobilicoccus pelagius]GAB49952.1 putative ABC transporter ATP-binding protein [Mobilicoccus pelagius NBRC 104925]
MIRFDHVTKTYPGGTVAVDDLTLEAPRGEITVLVGPSGCGKTTSLRMVNRMVEPTSGTILLDGVDVSTMSQAELRRGIGYVIQHGGLFPHRTIEQNVMTVPRLLGRPRAEARDRARELLEVVGLSPDLASRYPGQLSGGQQQRVGVARALAADPPVLLMDEPFSAVDPVVREQLQDELMSLQAQLQKTILLVTHDIDEAVKLGNRVAVMRVGGRLAQMDEPARLLAEPADDFVASFVGRDRGYRSLAFQDVDVPLHREAAVRMGEPVRGDWRLVVDDESRPLGWIDGSPARGGEDVAAPESLRLGGTLARRGGSLRAYLDAALSSPSRRGVVVDDDGVLVGIVHPSEVLAAIEAAGRAGADDAEGAP